VSRREADDLIAGGKIVVSGEKAVLGQRVSDADEVKYEGKVVSLQARLLYLVLNKPVGYVSSRKRQGETPTLYELLSEEHQSLKTVGRLDKNSSGLILLTNDGDFAHRMTHPKFIKVKMYEVGLDRALEPLHQQMIGDFGINLVDGTSKLQLESMDGGRKKWRVTMSEGRNRQIRRTFGALGYTVVDLNRIQFGKYSLGELAPGKYKEVEALI
jgi:23S rRNA pseudouridine2605 synthase